MASRPPDPKKATGSTKRFREDLVLAQKVLKARVALDKASEALNEVLQMVINNSGEEEASPLTPVPISIRPTRLDIPAFSTDAFTRHIRGMWAKAKTEKDQNDVRDLVKKGVAAQVIPEDVGEGLEEEFRQNKGP